MKFKRKHLAVLVGIAVAGAAYAATLYIKLDPPVVVSKLDTDNNAYKAKMGWISYKSDPTVPQYDVKAQLLVYADGAAGKQNIWIARSIDNGATWTETKVTNNGGNVISVTDPVTLVTESFDVTNNKPNIFVPPIGVLNAGKGADALLTWTSSDCEGSAAQKINTNLVPLTGKNQPYMCLWAARSLDGGVTWSLQRLTDGSMDPDEDVPAGSVQYTTDTASTGHFAITFQADPKGLQLGDAEGTGDGASGANVSPGTNIWYTYLSKANFELGTTLAFPAPVQVSDNNDTATGKPGASRANLGISGSTAVIAYEETKGDGSGGKQIIYHSFPASNYPALDSHPAGDGISNTANNARRVRFLLQGKEAFASSLDDAGITPTTTGTHVMLLWRETTLTTAAAASDVVVRRGIKNTISRPGSTGFLATDVLADTPINLSDPTAASLTDNSLAQRGVLRGEFAAIAYDLTPDKAAADATPPTGTYNLFIKRSTDGGNTWSAAKQMSSVTNPAIRVVEPRLVGTPGTIVLPNKTATSDPSDVQNRNVMYVSWGTETNSATPVPEDIFLTRTTDQGVSYETVQMLAEGVAEQSEAQLRSPPDGKTLGALWMEKNGTATDVMYRNGVEAVAPDVPPATTTSSSGGGGGCAIGSGNAPFDPVLPMLAAMGLIGFGLRYFRRS